MKRRWIALIVVILVAIGGYAYSQADRDPDTSGLPSDFDKWSPSSDELRQTAKTNGTDADTPAGKQLREKFALVFENRYRHHEPPMAIGMRFLKGNLIKLMCPARMEPWNMDRLAIQTMHETQTAFGHPFNIDIYVTFIGSTPIKVGEMRPTPKDPKQVFISYVPVKSVGVSFGH